MNWRSTFRSTLGIFGSGMRLRSNLDEPIDLLTR